MSMENQLLAGKVRVQRSITEIFPYFLESSKVETLNHHFPIIPSGVIILTLYGQKRLTIHGSLRVFWINTSSRAKIYEQYFCSSAIFNCEDILFRCENTYISVKLYLIESENGKIWNETK